MDYINEAIHQSSSEGDISMKYLTFMIDSQHYAISIANVIEIVQMQPVTELPEFPEYAKGIINLRGRVVPLIDMNIRFGNPESVYAERTCIIIVDFEGTYIGMIVDEVEEVLDIDEDIISPPPSLSENASEHYVTGIGKLDKCMVLLINSSLLFSDIGISVPMGEPVI